MRTLIVHNAYGKYSGEEAVVDAVCHVLEGHGQEVAMFRRSSEELADSFLGKIRGFVGGIYSPSGVRGLRDALKRERPDVVNVHNVYPLISPAALFECKKAGVPVVMTVHNYRLVCPTGLFMRGGAPCEVCLERGNEWGCVKYNCEGGFGKSAGYALRNYVARRTEAFMECVDIFSCITDFQRTKLIEAGFPEKKIRVNPNFLDVTTSPEFTDGEYVGYCGRLSEEKGIDYIFEIAKRHPKILFKFAGNARNQKLISHTPNNCIFVGHLNGKELIQFVQQARFMLMASKWYEGFPMAILEAAAQGKPCIGPDHGGFTEIIGKGSAAIGRLFRPGNVEDLARQVKLLWDYPEECEALGRKAFSKLQTEYSSERFYERFLAICQELGAC